MSLILQPPFPVPLLRCSIHPEGVHLSGYTLGIRLEASGLIVELLPIDMAKPKDCTNLKCAA